MARLRDVPFLFRTVGPKNLARRVWREVDEDGLFTLAAALSYSWLLAVFPFLIFLLTLVPYLPEQVKDAARGEIHDLVYEVIPGQGAATIWDNIEQNLDNLLHQKSGTLLPRVLGLALALWAASGGMNMTMAALDRCYELDRSRPFYMQRPIALGLTLVVAAILMTVAALLPLGTIFKHWILKEDLLPRHHPLLILFDVSRWSAAMVFLFTALAIIYHKGVGVRHRFHWITPGAVFAVVVWILLGLVFRFYVDHFGKYNQTYGTVGGVVVLLLFFYLDALVLLIGAEINSEIDYEVLKVRRGSRNFIPAEVCADGAEPAPTSI